MKRRDRRVDSIRPFMGLSDAQWKRRAKGGSG